jgi:hypothetical protein
MRNIKKEMVKVKAGDFQEWFDGLNEEELKIYREEFSRLQLHEEPSPQIGSEGRNDKIKKSNK